MQQLALKAYLDGSKVIQGFSKIGECQNFLELILNGLSCEIALMYLDDNIIFDRTFEEFLERLELVLFQLEKAALKNLIADKKNILLLGLNLSNNGFKVDPEKIMQVST